MKIFLYSFFIFLFQLPLIAQLQSDSLSTSHHIDTTETQNQKDTIIVVTPIPDMGSIEPFGHTLNIISDVDIQWHEYRSLYDIFSMQQGIFVRDLASPGQQNQLYIGGLVDRNISILIDGVPYNDYHTGSFNFWLLPVDAVERIEYYSGSESIFYDGKSAGTINFITRNYNNNRAITNLHYSQGVNGYVYTDAFFAQNIFRGLNLTLGLSHFGFGSNKESYSYRGRFYNSNDDAWTFRAKLRYNVFDWLNVSVFYLLNKTWTGLYGGVDLSTTSSIFNELEATIKNYDSYEKLFNNHYHASLTFYPFQDSSLISTLTLFSLDRLREYRDEENRNVLNRNKIYESIDYSSYTEGAKFHLRFSSGFNTISYYTLYQQIKKQNEVTVGIKDDIYFQPYISFSPFITVIDSKGNNNINGGIFSELIMSSSISLFGGFSENFVNKIYGEAAFPSIQLGSTKNMSAYSTKEIGMKFTIDKQFTSKISFQKNEIKNPVIFDTIQIENPTLFILKNNYSYYNISASAHLTLGDFHLKGTGNYFKQPELRRNNVAITMYPEITFDGSAYYHGLLSKGYLDLKVGVRGRYFSKQTGMAPYDQYGVWIASSLVSFGPSSTVDFFAIGKIGDAYVHFVWENLTNTEYLLAPVYPMYSRNIRFGLSWEFLD